MQNKTKKPEKTISLSNLPGIIVAVVLIVGIGAVYGLMGYLFSGIKENITPVIQVSENKSNLDKVEEPVVFEEEEDISDWKVYRNEEFGFELKYPDSIKVVTFPNSDYQIDFRGSNEMNYAIMVTARVNSKISNKISNPECYREINTEMLNNIKWSVNDYLCTIGGKISTTCYSTVYNNHIFEISFHGNDLTNKISELNQILSTFKFIEKDEIAEWKTYRNEEYGFEVEYPGDWDNPLWQEDEYRKGITFGCPVFDFEGNEHCSLSLRISEAITKSEAIRNISINIGAYKKEDVIINEGGIPTIKEFTVDTREAITYHDAGICVEAYTKIFDSKMTVLFTDRCSVYKGEIFDQILSTFKFIEKDETADWQTYRNEEFGFEVEYPNEIIEEEDAFFFTGLIDKDTIVVKILFKRNKSSDDLVSDIEKDIIVQEAGAITSDKMVSFGDTLSRKIVYSLPTGTNRTIYYIERDKDTIEIIWGYYERENIKNIEKILSSFKFIEKK
ncbi:MAG: hypothetical protein KAQ87_03935 [Candidatus Pacebacteria bacterium]|nr:hypothetical protein [Candidatus Paceibacterota bacterium]